MIYLKKSINNQKYYNSIKNYQNTKEFKQNFLILIKSLQKSVKKLT